MAITFPAQSTIGLTDFNTLETYFNQNFMINNPGDINHARQKYSLDGFLTLMNSYPSNTGFNKTINFWFGLNGNDFRITLELGIYDITDTNKDFISSGDFYEADPVTGSFNRSDLTQATNKRNSYGNYVNIQKIPNGGFVQVNIGSRDTRNYYMDWDGKLLPMIQNNLNNCGVLTSQDFDIVITCAGDIVNDYGANEFKHALALCLSERSNNNLFLDDQMTNNWMKGEDNGSMCPPKCDAD